jgi:hypothetical protein
VNDKSKSTVPYEQLQGARAVAAPGAGGALANIEESRVIKAAEARVILAKRFPRDEELSRNKILKAFENAKLADAAMYSYPRGNTTIEDLSIRAAETMASYWGNLEYGIQEIDRQHGYSEMLSYCWDLEANVYHYRAFKARHWRDTSTGGYAVKDERDIYEVTFNLGARRLRSCILEALPAHIKEEAEAVINDTLRKAEGAVPLAKRVETMLASFLAEYKVTAEMIERRLGHSMTATSETEMVGLRKIYKTLKDGQAKADEFFEFGDPNAPKLREQTRPAEQEKPRPAAQAETAGQIDPNAHKTADAARAAAATSPAEVVEKAGASGPADAHAGKPPSQKEQIDASLDRLQRDSAPAAQTAAAPAATTEQKSYTGDPLSGSGAPAGLEPLDFTQAFTAIVQAKTVEKLDEIRSRIAHLTEKQRANLGTSIDNKMKSLGAASKTLE